jgi:hypothetical protein
MKDFLQEKADTPLEYDEQLVRRLIENVGHKKVSTLRLGNRWQGVFLFCVSPCTYQPKGL